MICDWQPLGRTIASGTWQGMCRLAFPDFLRTESEAQRFERLRTDTDAHWHVAELRKSHGRAEINEVEIC
jgi:hypothetical protein